MVIFKDNTINGACSNCGSCCGDLLPLSTQEIQKIKSFVNVTGIKDTKISSHTCPFRSNESMKCNIYQIRPWICRVFICNTKDFEKSDEPRKVFSMRSMIYQS